MNYWAKNVQCQLVVIAVRTNVDYMHVALVKILQSSQGTVFMGIGDSIPFEGGTTFSADVIRTFR
jgi:hypothetical protein